jgi:hypothetical protein
MGWVILDWLSYVGELMLARESVVGEPVGKTGIAST